MRVAMFVLALAIVLAGLLILAYLAFDYDPLAAVFVNGVFLTFVGWGLGFVLAVLSARYSDSALLRARNDIAWLRDLIDYRRHMVYGGFAFGLALPLSFGLLEFTDDEITLPAVATVSGLLFGLLMAFYTLYHMPTGQIGGPAPAPERALEQ